MPIAPNTSVNPFIHHEPSRDTPAITASLVTPNNAADLAVYAKALRIYNPDAEAGTVRVTLAGESDDLATIDLDVPPGLSIEPSAVRRVWQTGTSPALKIVAYNL